MYKFRVFFGFPQDNVYTDIELPVIPAKDEFIILHEEELREIHAKIIKKSEFLADWLTGFREMSEKEFIDLAGSCPTFFQVSSIFYVSNEEKIRITFHERATVKLQ